MPEIVRLTRKGCCQQREYQRKKQIPHLKIYPEFDSLKINDITNIAV